jgi:DNA-binding response OmpR family regulator
MHVLVVEDDAAVAVPLKEGLERNGFTVDLVSYAAQVVPAVRESAPDLVLLDLGLPDGDGLEVLREIRKTSDVPVIIAHLAPAPQHTPQEHSQQAAASSGHRSQR